MATSSWGTRLEDCTPGTDGFGKDKERKRAGANPGTREGVKAWCGEPGQ